MEKGQESISVGCQPNIQSSVNGVEGSIDNRDLRQRQVQKWQDVLCFYQWHESVDTLDLLKELEIKDFKNTSWTTEV